MSSRRWLGSPSSLSSSPLLNAFMIYATAVCSPPLSYFIFYCPLHRFTQVYILHYVLHCHLHYFMFDFSFKLTRWQLPCLALSPMATALPTPPPTSICKVFRCKLNTALDTLPRRHHDPDVVSGKHSHCLS